MGQIFMSECVMAKTLTVTNVNVITELATGDLIYQVMFGNYIRTTPEILSRIPPNAREPLAASKNIAVSEMTLFIKTNEVPYKVGSKWNIRISKNGRLNLVEAK
jgi:hypothetical protein